MFKKLTTAAILAFCAGTAATAADLTVTFETSGKAAGTIKVALYGSEETFLAPDGAIATTAIPAGQSPASYVFKDLRPGQYAISAYQDMDDNGHLDRNAFGAPSEPWGASRDARGFMGPPTYADAVFTVTEEGGSQTIRLH